jgi:hypothetical protein
VIARWSFRKPLIGRADGDGGLGFARRLVGMRGWTSVKQYQIRRLAPGFGGFNIGIPFFPKSVRRPIK